MERVKGIEPSSQPWEGHILPLNHTRLFKPHCTGAPARKESAAFYQIAARLATRLHYGLARRVKPLDGLVQPGLDYLPPLDR